MSSEILLERAEELFRRFRSAIRELPDAAARTQLQDLQDELEVHNGELQRTIDELATRDAYHDALTKLPNRWVHMDRERAIGSLHLVGRERAMPKVPGDRFTSILDHCRFRLDRLVRTANHHIANALL